MSDYGVKIGIKADTGIMLFNLLKPSTDNTSSVTDMMSDLNWAPLEVHRIRYRLIFFYKVIHHLVVVPYSNLLIPVDTRTRLL
jgi:hypothetical protein